MRDADVEHVALPGLPGSRIRPLHDLRDIGLADLVLLGAAVRAEIEPVRRVGQLPPRVTRIDALDAHGCQHRRARALPLCMTAADGAAYRACMARYVIDAHTLLLIADGELPVHETHRLV